MGYPVFTVLSLIIIIIVAAGCAAEETPAIILQNEHQSLSADFIGDVISGSAPLAVSFTDMSTDSPGEWAWDFGDGTQDTSQNPIHIYTTPGIYSVSLSITCPSGTDRKTRLGYIDVKAGSIPESPGQPGQNLLNPDLYSLASAQVSPTVSPIPEISPKPQISPVVTNLPESIPAIPETVKPVSSPQIQTSQTDLLNMFSHPVHADFSPSVTSGKAPLSVSFTDQSTGGGSGWAWDFGDSNTSDIPSPEHTYTKSGNYTVRLTVQGEQGADTALRHDLIEVTEDPVASFTAFPRSGSTPLTVGFTDHSSGTITSREWDFGDGSVSNESSPVHMYTNPGTYVVSLTVTGPDGSVTQQMPDPITVTGSIEPPNAGIIVNTSSGTAPLSVQFHDNSTGDVTTRTWDFGDGVTASEGSISHTYRNSGSYPVTLIIKGPAGESRAEVTITVSELKVPDIAPVSTFSVDHDEGESPLSVIFTDTTIGNVTGWKWDFGDGTISEEQNTTHLYTTPGSYKVVLVVTGPGGESSSDKTISVREPPVVLSPPTASISADNTEGIAPLTVSFRDGSTGDVTGWKWDFGDGTTSDEQNATHLYTTPGSYTVVLTATGPGGKNSAHTTISVREPPVVLSPPTAAISADNTEGVAPLTVTFRDGSTGEVNGWKWDFGDGSVSEEQHPSHTYSTPGSYKVVLTVRGPGGEDISESVITVQKPLSPLVASFSSDLTEGTAPLTVSFTDSSTGEITGWKWDYGDGTTGTEQNPGHVYQNAGIYHAVLTISGPQGESKVEKTISVKTGDIPNVLTAAFTSDKTGGDVPLTVLFTDASTGEITGRKWDFGDGSVSEEQHPSHTYTNPGFYLVTLIIHGPSGESRKDATISVNEPASPVKKKIKAGFSTYDTEGSAPLTVSFMDTSEGDISEYSWDFGDGSYSTEASPRHTYTVPGTYPAVLTVKGPDGESRTDASLILVTRSMAQPWAEIRSDKTMGQAPLTVSFADASTGEITGWKWDFGDGVTSSEQNVDHVFSQPGSYPVTLIVTGPGGTSHSDLTIIVNHPDSAPVAAFNVSSSAGSAPCSVSFTDNSTGNITGWNWNFGDDSVISEQNPTHVYMNPGTYVATLSISGPGGSGYAEQNITVTAVKPKPDIDFTADKTSGVIPFRVHLHPVTNGSVDGHLWDLGDGTISYDEEPVHTYESPGEYSVSLTISGHDGVSTVDKPGFITARTISYPPNATISADITSGASPLTVTYTGTADEPVDTYNWFFGDGTTETGETVSHTYQSPGGYDVTLIASGPGGSDTVVNPAYITVTDPIIPLHASLTATPPSGVAPLTVSFMPETTGNVQNYLWNFGDNSTSVEVQPNHTYDTPGEYPVSLTVSGADGNYTAILDPKIKVNRLTNPPLATISADISNGTAPLHVSLSANTTGVIDGYVWDFGDGSSSYDINPTHAYAIPGNYTVRLTISGPEGASEVRLPTPIMVLPGDKIPVAGFSADPVSGYAPLDVSFTDGSTGTVDSYFWDLGDGTVSDKKNPVHRYTEPGIYTVHLQVSGQTGRSDETKAGFISVETRPEAPVARFQADKRSGRAPLTVSLQDMSTGTVTDWIWDLGDGNISTEKNPVNIYARPGVFSVNQTVIGPGGDDSAIRRGYITVSAAASPPAAVMYAEPLRGIAPLTVRFLDISEGSVTRWNWDFGDGSTSQYKNPTHLYQKPGSYQVRLQVNGTEGGSSTEMIIRVSSSENSGGSINRMSAGENLQVISDLTGNSTSDVQKNQSEGFPADDSLDAIKPVADFTIMPRSGAAPLSVSFTDTSSGNITGWSWDFGDGIVSTTRNPDYTFHTPGTYSVSLTVSGPGGTSSKRLRDAIQVIDSSP